MLKTSLIVTSFLVASCMQGTTPIPSNQTESSHIKQKPVGINTQATAKKTVRSTEYIRCTNKASSRLEQTECQNLELEREDIRLNQAYKTAIGKIQEFRRFDLKQMQILWIQYRDKKCDFFYHKESGSGGQNDALDCHIDMTQQRANELEALF
ncbi:lysozyme inhibitor LprI family protein [Vibrio hepatarius]|uniref:lysozyme inhibitor LprI family protein n=1 Tax=Vibrio hepatarius TaxID=171383 RepID=UPI001C09C348|nr:lysozyme inhibitor LprI family protein [Vibrio hepatarius]MBU2897803.1 DUF1311 domain-containing protein [Vibrio hepatarius]